VLQVHLIAWSGCPICSTSYTAQARCVVICTPDGRTGCNLPTSSQIAPLDNPASCMHENTSGIGFISSKLNQGSFVHLMSMQLIQRTRHRSRGPRRCCAQGRPGGMAAADLLARLLCRVCWPGLLQRRCTALICLRLHIMRVLLASVLRSLAAAQQVPRRAGIPAPARIAL
jgi:hypothetical protein